MDLYAMAPSGVFSAAAVKAAAIGAPLLRLLVSGGKAFPLPRGWYSVQRPVNHKHRHRLRVAALLQEYEGQVMASHGSAPFRAFSRVQIHELVPHHGLAHGRDVVDMALAAAQVGLRRQSSVLVLADHALHHELTTPDGLRAAVAALNSNRGILQARAALPWCDGRHASPGETLTALVLRGLGYRFTPQFEITRREHPGRSFFADFRIDDTPVLVEFDGRVKYDPSESERAAVANFDEKQREDEIRRRRTERSVRSRTPG